MSLGHVYIVLEPVGSPRLTFDDDRYYEFMCFDVQKVVRSPGCDHGHDEESRNGRYIKIDILDGYIRTPEVFRMVSEKTGVPEGLLEPPGKVLGLSGPQWRRERAGQRCCTLPPCPVRIGQGAQPPFPSSSPLFPLLLLQQGRKESYSRWE